MAGKDSPADIDKTLKSLTKAEDIRQDMIIMSSRNIKWEDFLQAAPKSITLLGQLMLVAGAKDFTLDRNPPKAGFQLLKYPSSFRACLVQVSNEGWKAFNTAHSSMEQVKLHTANVPGHLKAAVKIITTGTPNDVVMLLPNSLASIQEIAEECVIVASETEREFVSVMNLIGELLEACTNAKGQYEEDLKQTNAALRVAQEAKKENEEQKKFADKQYKDMEKQLADSRKDYRDAMDDMPTGWNQIGMETVKSITSTVANTVNSFTSMAQLPKQLGLRLLGDVTAAVASSLAPDVEQVDHDSAAAAESRKLAESRKSVYKYGEQLHTMCTQIVNLATGEEGFKRKGASADLAYLEKRGKKIKKDIIKEAENNEKQEALKMCDSAYTICKELSSMNKSMKKGKAAGQTSKLSEDATQLKESADAFLVRSNTALGTGASLGQMSPNLAKVKSNEKALSKATEAAMENHRFKMNLTCETMKDAQQGYDKACQNYSDASHKLTETIMEISKCDLEKLDFEQIRKTLIDGMKSLAEVREQWGKLVKFFQSISNLIKCSLNTSLKDLNKTLKSGSEQRREGITLSGCMLDAIYQQAFGAAKVAHVTHHVSSLYLDVSNNYLMDRVASLGKLIALDPETEAPIIKREMNNLVQGCADTQKALERMVRQKNREFEAAVNNRIACIEQEMQAALPPAPPGVEEKYKKSITENIAASKEDDDDQYA